MVIRILFIIFTCCNGAILFGQEFPLMENGKKIGHYSVDTLYLGQFSAKKVIAYKLQSVTFYMDYKDYLKDLSVFWKRYRKGMKGLRKEKAKGEYINPEYEPRWRVIDSVYRTIKNQYKTQDTIYVSQKPFDKVGLGCLAYLETQIEKGTCTIVDNKNIKQTIIIRRKEEWQRGYLEGWGGRKYFVPGQITPFYSATDWMS